MTEDAVNDCRAVIGSVTCTNKNGLDTLVDRLVSWSQDREMVDVYYTDHGRDCIEAARIIDALQAENDALRFDVERLNDELNE